MTVKKLKNGQYQARFQFDRKRYKRNFSNSRDARAWEANTLKQLASGEAPAVKKDRRKLSELADRWYQLHGYTIKTGKTRLSKLHHIAKMMGDPVARQITPSFYNEYRSMRLADGSSENNCNHELAYLKAVFSELIRHEDWEHENPFAKVRKLKFDEKEMRYLTREEIRVLLAECENSRNKDLAKVVEICLRTGARWGEAISLSSSDIQIQRKRAWIVYEGTKSGKVRRVPVEVSFARHIRGNRIGSKPLFKDCMVAFKCAMKRSNIELPAGQFTHVLRHSFASHYMMNGGDILKLQKLMGHSTIVMTMRYAHLAPGALEDVLQKHALN